MKIKTIRASGLKGCKKFEHNLAGVTVFTGANAQGKTTRLETIQLATSANVQGLTSKPGTKASAKDIHDHLASADLLHTYFDTDTGASVTRDWRKIKDSVKLQETFIGLPEGFSVAPVLHDQMVFLGLSAKERTKFLFRTLTPPSLDKVSPAVFTANIKNIKVAENTEATEAVIKDLCAFVEESWQNRGVVAAFAANPMTTQEWLDQFVESVRKRGNDAAATAKRMAATNAGLTQLKVDGASFSAAEQAKATAQRTLDEAKRVLTELRGNYTRAKADLDAARTLAAAAVDETAVRLQIAEITADIERHARVQPPPPPSGTHLSTECPTDKVARDAWKDADQILYWARRDKANCAEEIVRIKSAIEAAGQKKSCPTCGHDITDQQAEAIASLEVQLKRAVGNDDILAERLEVKTKAEKEAAEALASVTESIKAWNKTKTELDAQNQAAIDAYNICVNAYNSAQAAINDAKANINRLEASIAGNLASAAAKANLGVLEYKANRLLEDGKKQADTVAAAQTSYNTADQALRQAIADKATAQSQARALAEEAKAKVEVEIIKQFDQFLNELMTLIIEQSVQPLLATCNRICDGILRHPLALVDGEIGMRNPEAATGFVSWKTFSGAERALTFAALSVALSVGQPFKLVMIDEFGKLSVENKTKMFSRLLKLVEEKFIDQAIIVDPDANFYKNVGEVKDFACIEITRE